MEINPNYEVYNPNNKPIEELKVIYGFNNGGSPGWYTAQLLSEDGYPMGNHLCSSEGFMLGDLGILKGFAKSRHKYFQSKYPDGYRMDFVKHDSKELFDALEKNKLLSDDQLKEFSEEGQDSKVEITFSSDEETDGN